jgi:predicted glycosyltransferase
MKTLWFDVTNAPHVHFLLPIINRYLTSANVMISVRDYSEAVELARNNYNMEPKVIGEHGGRGRIRKVSKLLSRLNSLERQIKGFDYSISCGGFESCLFAKLRRKVSIVFDDNDVSPNWMYSRLASYSFFPDAIPREVLFNQGFKLETTYQYRGYKEDIYVADYEPDSALLNSVPFRDYVVVRPENRMANYIKSKPRSIVPELLRSLSANRFKILYLPRTEGERKYAYGVDGVFIPRNAVNGLDASYFSQAVLSGAGSLCREAACIGKPAVSFFPGKRLLAVDQKMVKDGWLFHSRNPREIVEYIQNAQSRRFDRKRSKSVQDSVFDKLDDIILK